MKCNVKLSPNYFPVNVSVLAVVFCQQNLKNQQFKAKLIILIMRTQVLFSDVFSEKDPHLNGVEYKSCYFNGTVVISISG